MPTPAPQPPAITIAGLTASAQLIALFDAFAACEIADNTLFQLHGRGGVTVSTLYTWAKSRDLPVIVDKNGQHTDCHEVIVGDPSRFAKIIVHVRRAAVVTTTDVSEALSTWRPADGEVQS